MSDEREIDILATAANRGRPRGAESVWHEASARADHARTKRTNIRVVRAGVAVACGVLALLGVGVLWSGDSPSVQMGGVRVARFAHLPDGWSTVRHAEPTRGTSTFGPFPRLTVYQRGTDVLVVSAFSSDDSGIAWTIAEGPSASEVTVAGMNGRLSEGGNLNELSVLTVTRSDGEQSRVLARGLSRDDFLGLAGQAIARTVPPGFRTTYDGTEASGLIAAPAQLRPSSVTVELPNGKQITVISAATRFDPSAVWWLYPSSSRLGIRGHEALLLELRNERSLAWEEDGLNVLIVSTDATIDELRTAANALQFDIVDGVTGSSSDRPGDTLATTSTTTTKK